MPPQPVNPRLGNERQKRQRQLLEMLMQQQQGQASNFSRFARTGSNRGTPAGVRGGYGPRMFAGAQPGRVFGATAASTRGGNRGGMRGAAPFNPFADQAPRVGNENAPGQALGGQGPPVGGQGIGYGRQQISGGPMARGIPGLPQGPTGLAGGVLDYAQSAFGGDQTSLQGGGQLGAPNSAVGVGGLIPLGGGAWYDPASGQLYGVGGGGGGGGRSVVM